MKSTMSLRRLKCGGHRRRRMLRKYMRWGRCCQSLLRRRIRGMKCRLGYTRTWSRWFGQWRLRTFTVGRPPTNSSKKTSSKTCAAWPTRNDLSGNCLSIWSGPRKSSILVTGTKASPKRYHAYANQLPNWPVRNSTPRPSSSPQCS